MVAVATMVMEEYVTKQPASLTPWLLSHSSSFQIQQLLDAEFTVRLQAKLNVIDAETMGPTDLCPRPASRATHSTG